MTSPRDDRTGEPVPDPIFEQSAAEEVADELEFHIDMRTRELIDRGMSPEVARREARERFEDLPGVQAQLHHLATQRDHAMKRTRYLTDLAQDIQFAWRMLRKRAGFAFMAILPRSRWASLRPPRCTA